MGNLGTGSGPDKPGIRIVTRYESGVGLVGSWLALRGAATCCRLGGGGLSVPDTGDVIETQEGMKAVPVYGAPQSRQSPCAGT